ncbi:hypothetical protein [Parasphingorhabdus sp.]|uniref:hypothetical protein n=1 Tax=Parasphingorhabdus sp. TaxID=2709688 RepID=UPI003A94A22E
MIPYLTIDHFSALADLGIACAAGFAAWQGVKSLKVWRSERIGGRHIELAEESLIQFYEVENALNVIRSPMSWSSETDPREVDEGESRAQKYAKDIAFTTFKRMELSQETFSKFYATSLKVKAVLGPEYHEPFTVIRKCYGEVRVSAQMLFQTPFEGYEDSEFRQKLEQDVWNMERTDPQSIEQRVKLSVEAAEANFTKILKHH